MENEPRAEPKVLASGTFRTTDAKAEWFNRITGGGIAEGFQNAEIEKIDEGKYALRTCGYYAGVSDEEADALAYLLSQVVEEGEVTLWFISSDCAQWRYRVTPGKAVLYRCEFVEDGEVYGEDTFERWVEEEREKNAGTG